MEVLACLNGETMPVEQARVPVWDRGFLFGDSVYEVCRIYRGRCWLEAEHFARLRRSLRELEFPPVDLDRLVDRIHRTIAASGIEEGTVYMQITRGVAPRSHAFPDPPVPPTELIVVRPYDDAPDRPAPRDRGQGHQPSRPALEALRHQDDQPPGQLHRDRGRAPRRLLTRRSWSTPTAWSPRRRIPRCSGSGKAGSRARPKAPRSSRGRPDSSSSGCSKKLDIPFVEARVTLAGTEGGRRADPGRDDDRGRADRPGRRRRRSPPDGPAPWFGRLWDAYRQDVERWLAGHASTV